ncbi:hypothetical protein AX16_010144 [Volvariella volvacea WC 439]|nr:hypothetical protein AX16_010144 [Volvariella volvacea WC 439]
MGDPQHYQPLSQALNPPTQPVYSSTGLYQPSKAQHISNLTSTPQHRPEEEEEEEEDDEDEGMVEEQLNSRNEADNHGSNPASPHNKGTGPSASQKLQTQPSTQPTQPQDPSSSSTQQQPQKRRPGRPRGSKNRKPRVVSGTSTMKPDQSASFYVASNVPQNQAAAPAPQPQPTTTAAPPSFPEINNQNHHYYEFQWRVLNLCAEFYGAAEELVKATPPLVVAQCYQMMPDSKVDPLSMLAEAKRICDTLLNNPSRLIQNPPPPMYPTAPQLYHGQTATTSAAPVTAPAPSTSVSAPPAAPATSTASTSAKPAPIASTSSAPATTTPATAQPQIINPQVASTTNPTQTVTAPQASSSNPTPAVQPQASTSSSGPATQTAPTNAHGAWSEEEVDRLKKLFEESRTKASTAEAQWDWVIRHRFIPKLQVLV